MICGFFEFFYFSLHFLFNGNLVEFPLQMQHQVGGDSVIPDFCDTLSIERATGGAELLKDVITFQRESTIFRLCKTPREIGIPDQIVVIHGMVIITSTLNDAQVCAETDVMGQIETEGRAIV